MEEAKKEDALGQVAEPGKEKELEWYFRPWTIAIAIFVFGPLGLLLLWFRPRTSIYLKVGVSVVIIGLTVWLVQGTMYYYREMMEHFQELSEAMREQ